MRSTAPFDVIARRELDVEGESLKVIVELGKPVFDGTAFGCTFRLSYAGKERQMTIFGEDAFQALMLALKTVSVDLKHTDWLPRDRMHWLEPGNGTGFSDPDTK